MPTNPNTRRSELINAHFEEIRAAQKREEERIRLRDEEDRKKADERAQKLTEENAQLRANEARKIAGEDFEQRNQLVRRGPDGSLVSATPDAGSSPGAQGRSVDQHLARLEQERDKQIALHESLVDRSQAKTDQDIERESARNVERNEQLLARDQERMDGLARNEHSAKFHREAERFEHKSRLESERYGNTQGDKFSPEYLAERERYAKSVDAERDRLTRRNDRITSVDKDRIEQFNKGENSSILGKDPEAERKRIYQTIQSRETAIGKLGSELDRVRMADRQMDERQRNLDAKRSAEPAIDLKHLDQAKRLDIQLDYEHADRRYQRADRNVYISPQNSPARERYESAAQAHDNDRLAAQKRLIEFDREIGHSHTRTADRREQQHGGELQRRQDAEAAQSAKKDAELKQQAKLDRERRDNAPSALEQWAEKQGYSRSKTPKQEPLREEKRAEQRQDENLQRREQQVKPPEPVRDEKRARPEQGVEKQENPRQQEIRRPEPVSIQGYGAKVERDHVAYSKEAEPDQTAFRDFGKRLALDNANDIENRRAALTLATERFSTIGCRGTEEYKRSMAEAAHEMGLGDRFSSPEMKGYVKEIADRKQQQALETQAQGPSHASEQIPTHENIKNDRAPQRDIGREKLRTPVSEEDLARSYGAQLERQESVHYQQPYQQAEHDSLRRESWGYDSSPPMEPIRTPEERVVNHEAEVAPARERESLSQDIPLQPAPDLPQAASPSVSDSVGAASEPEAEQQQDQAEPAVADVAPEPEPELDPEEAQWAAYAESLSGYAAQINESNHSHESTPERAHNHAYEEGPDR